VSETFDPYAPGSAERLAAMARIRVEGGVVETPAGYYFASAAGVSAGLHDVEKFVGSFIDTSALAEDEGMISAIPEPRHGCIRRVINTVVATHRTMQAEPFIRAEATRLVDAAVTAGADRPVDLVTEVVDPLPSAVIAHMIGVPVTDQERFRIWSDELLAAQNSGAADGLSNAHPEFAAYIQALIDEHRAADDPPDDIITRFLRADVDGESLSDRAIRTQTMFIIVAGNETTRNLEELCARVSTFRLVDGFVPEPNPVFWAKWSPDAPGGAHRGSSTQGALASRVMTVSPRSAMRSRLTNTAPVVSASQSHR
jgi:cytochrome P450